MNRFKIRSSMAEAVADHEIKVLLVGNNPIEMSAIYDKLFGLKDKIKRIETAFTQEDVLSKISLAHPNCVMLDDNLGVDPLKAIIKSINSLGKEAISITLLKSHNRQEITSGVQEYLMKDGLDESRIYSTLRNALKFRRTQLFFRVKYYSGKKSIKRMFR